MATSDNRALYACHFRSGFMINYCKLIQTHIFKMTKYKFIVSPCIQIHFCFKTPSTEKICAEKGDYKEDNVYNSEMHVK